MNLPFVQNTYTDRPQSLYAGQLADYASNTLAQGVRSYRIQGPGLYFGRGVVKGSVNAQFPNGTGQVTTPYGVIPPVATGTPSVEADFVGILVYELGGFGPIGSGVNNGPVGPHRDKTMNAVAERYSGVVIGAEVPASVTVAHGDPVYLVLADGSFHKAAATGRILIPDLQWYGATVGPAAVTGVAPVIGRIFMSARGPQGIPGTP